MSLRLLIGVNRTSSGYRGLPAWISLVSLVLTGAKLEAEEARIGQDSGGAQEKPDRDAAKRLEGMRRSLGRYKIQRDVGSADPLTLVAEPVLLWSNPVRGATDGGAFLWVAGGRPEVVSAVYRNKQDGITVERHEFLSLSTAPLAARYDGRMIWAPRTAGLTMAPIPDAPRPAATSAERLRQMRTLARQFQADVLDRDQTSTSLRLLSQPLHRYEPGQPDLADGALFAFVLATDPEAILVIEARPSRGAMAWHYGLGRMSAHELRARHNQHLVWHAPRYMPPRDPAQPYMGFPAPDQPP